MGKSAMRTVSLRSIAAHKIRLLLSILAVVLGTAFVTGSFAFTNTLQNTFDSLIAQGTEDIDAQLKPKEPGGQGVDNSVTTQLRARPDVAKVEPYMEGVAILIKSDGKPYQTGGAPSQGIPWRPEDEQISSQAKLTDGRGASNPGEIMLSRSVLEASGYRIGDTAKVVVLPQGPLEAKIVGTYSLNTDVGGYVGIAFSPDQARELFTDGEHVTQIAIQASAGVSSEELKTALSASFPELKVQTGSEVAAETSAELADQLSFVNYFLTAFGLVALLVGTFIIYNTFAMLVAQRLRELALLRAIGASRRQITGSILGEAFVIGAIGSLLGVVAGFGLSRAIFWFLEKQGSGLPNSGLKLTAMGIVVPLVLGIAITMISALAPARRAGKIPPVIAMRAGNSVENEKRSTRALVGILFLVLGLILALAGRYIDVTKTAAITVGVGSFGLIVGAFFLMPLMARPIAGGIGRVIGLPFGAIGRLAATNAGRNTRRTAATAFALTLGLALVAAFGTLGSSTKISLDAAVDQGIRADYLVSGIVAQGPPAPLPLSVEEAVASTPGVDAAIPFRNGLLSANGENEFFNAVGFDVGRAVDVDLVEGSAVPETGTIVVSESVVKENGWKYGSTVQLAPLGGDERTFTVGGVYRDNQLLQGWYMGLEDYEIFMPYDRRSTSAVFAVSDNSVSSEQLRVNLEESVADVPTAMVKDKEQIKGEQARAIDQLLTVIYALLGLALVIAILGIINTLALSVIERRGEIGMLRAVGMKRSQVRTIINLESTQIAIFGAIVGAALGVLIGWAFVSALANEGLTTVAIPWATIGVVLLSSAAVGVLASLWPAQRAASTSPLEAIAD